MSDMHPELPCAERKGSAARTEAGACRRVNGRHARSKKSICIISQLHPSMNPRLVAGYKVSVIAAEFSARGRQADEEFRNRAWRIVARARFGPEAPWMTRIAELVRRTVAHTAYNLGIAHPHIVRAAWHPAGPALVRAAKRQRVDLYIGHLVSGLAAAAVAARHNGALYSFDAEDFHPGDLPDEPAYAAENRMVRLIEERYLTGCAYTTAAAPLIAEAYRDEYGITLPKTVLNVFPLSYAPTKPTAAGAARPGPSVYWFSQTIGPTRGLECAIKAIALAKTVPHLCLRGKPASGFAETLSAIAAEAGVSDRVHILEPGPPSEMERLAALHDIGLAGEIGETRNRSIALTNKQFTYLLAGLPIAMSDIPAHRAFAASLKDCISLYRVDCAQSLADVLDGFLEESSTLELARARAHRLGQQRFNWDQEKHGLVQEVDKVLLDDSNPSAAEQQYVGTP